MITDENDKIFCDLVEEAVTSRVVRALSADGTTELLKEVAKNLAIEKINACVSFSVEDKVWCLDNLNDTLDDTFDNNNFHVCEVTRNLYHTDHLIAFNYRGETSFVSACVNTYECEECNERFVNHYQPSRNFNRRNYELFATHSYMTTNGVVCQGCYDEHYTSCSGCSDTWHNDEIQFHEGTDCYYCEGCLPSGLELVTNRMTLPAAANTSSDGLAVGWEIELYPSSDAETPSAVHVERIYMDGSLQNHGREITTQPALPGQWRERLDGLRQALVGGEIESDCGGHLHVDARLLHKLLWKNYVNVNYLRDDQYSINAAINNLRNIHIEREQCNSIIETLVERYEANKVKLANVPTERTINKLPILIIYYQNVLRLLCERKRNESTYAQPQSLTRGLNYDKYAAMNVSGLQQSASRNTVEFRLWGGSINPEELYHRAEVCEAIVRKLTEVVEKLNSPDTAIEAACFIQARANTDLLSNEGFWDIFEDGDACLKYMRDLRSELGLSDEWMKWAKQQISNREPEKKISES